jgi:aspartate/methionine/tyrosine aminotransferase
MEGLLRLPTPCRFARPDGGFYVTVRLEGIDEEEASEALLRDDCLLVHPGYFYDMPPHHLVFSYVQRPELMQEHVPKLSATLARLVSRS